MRMHRAIGVIAAVVAIAVSCTSEKVSSPPILPMVVSLANNGNGGGGGGNNNDCGSAIRAMTAAWTTEECLLLGRFTGGGGQEVAVDNIYVTRGFTLHCDVLLSNNLEINWPGNKWHTDKPFTAVRCEDDPTIGPEPPAAPADTYIGDGTGDLNGVPGARAVVVLKDDGERNGGDHDFMSIQVYDALGNLVLDVPLSRLTNGNIQAHFDQPHR